MPLMTANSYMGLAAETTYGVAASIGTLTPVDTPKVTPGIVWLDDSDFRGSPVKHYDQVPGVAKCTYDFKTFTYTDIYGNLVRAALGSTDAVASVGPSLFTHTIGLLNSPNLGSQPPSYTILNDSVDASYQMLASRLNTLNVSFSAEAAVENTVQFITNLPTTAASIPATNVTSQHLVPAWNCSASLGGVSSTVLESVSMDVKRNAAQIYTLGSQSAYNNFSGPIEVSGKIAFVAELGETVWSNALIRDQQALNLALVDPVTNYSITFTMSAVQLENPVITQSKAFVEVMTDFIAVADLTDPVNIGYSPLKVVIKNAIPTQY
jgi:hypothetical protein